jgi:hypothetical protein
LDVEGLCGPISKRHCGATLEQVAANTANTRGDFRLDVKRGALKA